MWPLDTWGSNFFPMYIKKQKIYSCMKQKVSTVPKATLSILGIGPYPRKYRNVKSILTESRAISFIISLLMFTEQWY